MFDAVKESWKTELMGAVDVVMPQSVTWVVGGGGEGVCVGGADEWPW